MKFSKIKFTSLVSTIALSMLLTVACSQDEAKPAETTTTEEAATRRSPTKQLKLKR